MNPNKLRAVMALNGETGTVLAEAMGISQQTLSAKINGKRDFTRGEIQFIKERYNLTPVAIDDIFFTRRVS